MMKTSLSVLALAALAANVHAADYYSGDFTVAECSDAATVTVTKVVDKATYATITAGTGATDGSAACIAKLTKVNDAKILACIVEAAGPPVVSTWTLGKNDQCPQTAAAGTCASTETGSCVAPLVCGTDNKCAVATPSKALWLEFKSSKVDLGTNSAGDVIAGTAITAATTKHADCFKGAVGSYISNKNKRQMVVINSSLDTCVLADVKKTIEDSLGAADTATTKVTLEGSKLNNLSDYAQCTTATTYACTTDASKCPLLCTVGHTCTNDNQCGTKSCTGDEGAKVCSSSIIAAAMPALIGAAFFVFGF